AEDGIRDFHVTGVQTCALPISFDAAAAAAADDAIRTGATMIPPFDDARTAAGQGTIAREVLEQLDGDLDVVLVPVGGGGLIAGRSEERRGGNGSRGRWTGVKGE